MPDGSIAAVTNAFTIRVMDFDDAENFLSSENLRSVALSQGWWQDGNDFDFTKVTTVGI